MSCENRKQTLQIYTSTHTYIRLEYLLINLFFEKNLLKSAHLVSAHHCFSITVLDIGHGGSLDKCLPAKVDGLSVESSCSNVSSNCLNCFVCNQRVNGEIY